jgi:hypothetical protein
MQHGDLVYSVSEDKVRVGRYTQYAEVPHPVVLYAIGVGVYKSEDLDRWYSNPADAIRAAINRLTVRYQQDLAKLEHLIQETIRARTDTGRQPEQGAADPPGS